MIEGVPSTSLQAQILAQLNDVSQQLGRVQGQLDHIVQEQTNAVLVRREMYQELNKIGGIRKDLDAIVPIVRELDLTRQRTLGAVWLGHTMWSFFGGTIAAGATMLATRLSGWPPH